MKPTWIVRDPFKPKTALVGIEDPALPVNETGDRGSVIHATVVYAMISDDASRIVPFKGIFWGEVTPDGAYVHK